MAVRPVPPMAFYFVKDVAAILSVSERKAYDIIRKFNGELEARGYQTLPGRVRQSYFNERFGMSASEPVASRKARSVRTP